jgi:deoxyribodipyrimidine photo-lyase
MYSGSPEETIPAFCRDNHITTLVTDFSPLRISRQWKDGIKHHLQSSTSFIEVDAHNVCPCWAVSKKCEFSAKTIRGKIHGLVDEYLHEYPPLRVQPADNEENSSDKWYVNGNEYTGSSGGNRDVWNGEVSGSILHYIRDVDKSVPEVTWLESGERAAFQALQQFLLANGIQRGSRLEGYSDDRNNPCLTQGSSNLSPYVHYGHLSTQRIVLEVCVWPLCLLINVTFFIIVNNLTLHWICSEPCIVSVIICVCNNCNIIIEIIILS